jgi:Dolichyl-phosphate-mannose-protein mannosyltransferase
VGIAVFGAQQTNGVRTSTGSRLFFFILLLLVGGAILRSATATRLDDFTYDEAYHIAAGTSYVQRADFRLNPEHPPLVKLWVGGLMAATGFHLSAFRPFNDKHDERTFAEEDVYFHNDADSIQRRSRFAMWALNGLLLVVLGAVLRKVFSAAVALGTILFLAIDPTVAANLPVVMTDLPIALLAATAVLLASVAFRTWTWRDLMWCSLATGLALGAKHSAPVFVVFLGITGFVLAFLPSRNQLQESILRRIAKVLVVLFGALLVLWGLYFFRFHETQAQEEAFNRPLRDKIADVNSPSYRFALEQLSAFHVVPRAYVWGLADVIRAGLEGRADSQLAFGHLFYKRVPRYFFPGVIAVKVPIGLSLLSILGIVALLKGQMPEGWRTPAILLLAAASCFYFVLSSGATYGGIRHALPLLVYWSIAGGFAAHATLSSSSKILKGLVGVALLAALASALPVMRPWEYYNEFVGGADNAYRYFDDEGVDISQRMKEMATYYHEVVAPTGEIPYIDCQCGEVEMRRRGIDWVGQNLARDEARMLSPIWSGTIITEAKLISRLLWWDAPELRAARPVARFGNLMIFRGQFHMPGKQAVQLYLLGNGKIYAEHPDLHSAEGLLEQSAAADPKAYFVHIALGNVRLRLGSREGALQAYKDALRYVPDDPEMRYAIKQQVQRVSGGSLDQIPPIRDPGME